MAATQIEESLLKANSLGQEELISVVKERVTGPREDGYHNLRSSRAIYVKIKPTYFQILSHELMAVALVISDTSGVSRQRRTENKSVMMELLSSGTARPRVTPIAGKSTLKLFLPLERTLIEWA